MERSAERQRCKTVDETEVEQRNESVRSETEAENVVIDEKSNNKKKFPIRRGRGSNKKSPVNNEFTIVGVNAAGIKTKFKSFKHIIDSVNAS